MAVGSGMADLIDVAERLERPARCILVAIGVNARKRVDIRPLLVPVAAERHQRALRDLAVLSLVCANVVDRHGIPRVLLRLLRNVDDCQREDQVMHIVLFGQRTSLHEVAREIDVGAELAWELEGLDQALELRLAPVPHRRAQLDRARRDARPVRTLVV